jgi:hypothetical protein
VKVQLAKAQAAVKAAEGASRASDAASEVLHKKLVAETPLQNGAADPTVTGSNDAALTVVAKLKEAQVATAAAHELRIANLGLQRLAEAANSIAKDKIIARDNLKASALHTIDRAVALAGERAKEAAARAQQASRELSAQLRLADKAASDAARAEELHRDPKEVSAALHSSLAQANVAKSLHDLAAAQAHLALFAKRIVDSLSSAANDLHALVEGKKPAPEADVADSSAAVNALSKWDSLVGPGGELSKLRDIVSAAKNIAQQAADGANAAASTTGGEGSAGKASSSKQGAANAKPSSIPQSIVVLRNIPVNVPPVDPKLDVANLVSSAADKDALQVPLVLQPSASPAAPSANTDADSQGSGDQKKPAEEDKKPDDGKNSQTEGADTAAAPKAADTTPESLRFADVNLGALSASERSTYERHTELKSKGSADRQQVLSFDFAIGDQLSLLEIAEAPEGAERDPVTPDTPTKQGHESPQKPSGASSATPPSDNAAEAIDSLKSTLQAIVGGQGYSAVAGGATMPSPAPAVPQIDKALDTSIVEAAAASNSSAGLTSKHSPAIHVKSVKICVTPQSLAASSEDALKVADEATRDVLGPCASDSTSTDKDLVTADLDMAPVVLANPSLAKDRATMGALAGSRAAVKYAAEHSGKETTTTLARLGAAVGAKAAVTHTTATAVGSDDARAADLKAAASTGASAAIHAVEEYLKAAGMTSETNSSAAAPAPASTAADSVSPSAPEAVANQTSGTGNTTSGTGNTTGSQPALTATLFIEMHAPSAVGSFDEISDNLNLHFARLMDVFAKVTSDVSAANLGARSPNSAAGARFAQSHAHGLSDISSQAATAAHSLRAAFEDINSKHTQLSQKIQSNMLSADAVKDAWGGKYAGPFDKSTVDDVPEAPAATSSPTPGASTATAGAGAGAVGGGVISIPASALADTATSAVAPGAAVNAAPVAGGPATAPAPNAAPVAGGPVPAPAPVCPAAAPATNAQAAPAAPATAPVAVPAPACQGPAVPNAAAPAPAAPACAPPATAISGGPNGVAAPGAPSAAVNPAAVAGASPAGAVASQQDPVEVARKAGSEAGKNAALEIAHKVATDGKLKEALSKSLETATAQCSAGGKAPAQPATAPSAAAGDAGTPPAAPAPLVDAAAAPAGAPAAALRFSEVAPESVPESVQRDSESHVTAEQRFMALLSKLADNDNTTSSLNANASTAAASSNSTTAPAAGANTTSGSTTPTANASIISPAKQDIPAVGIGINAPPVSRDAIEQTTIRLDPANDQPLSVVVAPGAAGHTVDIAMQPNPSGSPGTGSSITLSHKGKGTVYVERGIPEASHPPAPVVVVEPATQYIVPKEVVLAAPVHTTIEALAPPDAPLTYDEVSKMFDATLASVENRLASPHLRGTRD